MARFERAAAHTSDQLRYVARIMRSSDPLLTPSERKAAAEILDYAVSSQDAVTRFLADAPADAIFNCGCLGCQHIKTALPALRGIARRGTHRPTPGEHKVLPSL